MDKPLLCIHHHPCADGFTAAWVVKKAFPDAELYGANYYEAPPDVTGRDVIIVDFSYKRAVLEEMIAKCRSMIILDHHKSAVEDLAGVENMVTGGLNQVKCLFDMHRSGAMIAWNYFFPSFNNAPVIVNHVQDRDLWQFKLRGTKQVSAYIFSYDYTLENWDKLADLCEYEMEDVLTAGDSIERKQQKDTLELVASCKRQMTIGGKDVPVVNLPYMFASEAGNILAEQSPHGFGATYFDSAKGRKFSLRSIGDVDVAKIAERYGGGGHKNASGFTVPLGWEGDF